jgi:Ca2+-dependent lipid-binding protein
MPYCLVTTGIEVFTTKPSKKGKSLVWNEVFELLVTKTEGKKLEITVMARDLERDLFVGSNVLIK